jgi:hypothetical protein
MNIVKVAGVVLLTSYLESLSCECAYEDSNPYIRIVDQSDVIVEGVVKKVLPDSNLIWKGQLKVESVYKGSGKFKVGDTIMVASDWNTECGYTFNTSDKSIIFMNYETLNGKQVLATNVCKKNIENTSQQILMARFKEAMKQFQRKTQK